MTGPVEILIEPENGVKLGSGPWQGLRVHYCQDDACQDDAETWPTFLVVGVPGQSLRDLLSVALTVVAHSDGNKLLPAGGLTVDANSGKTNSALGLPTKQLDLGVSA